MHFPWGSLLRGVLGHDEAVLAGIARLLAPAAEVTALVSVLPHDNAPPVPAPAGLATAYAGKGLGLVEARNATPAEVASSHSSWARRLRAGEERPVTLLRARAAEVRLPEREPTTPDRALAAGTSRTLRR